MTDTTQETILIGMDAHSVKITLCIAKWRHGSDPKVIKRITTTLDALENTYRRQVPAGSQTVLEASTNAFSIARRLKAIGQRAEVLASDTLSGRARADRINDRIDAENLVFAYARGGTRSVYVPSERNQHWRDVYFGYYNAVKDSVRLSNRIWAFCSGHGLKLPPRTFRRKAEVVRREVSARAWTKEEQFHVESLLIQYKHSMEVRERYEKRIVEIVAENQEMTRLMQLLGVRFVIAFALVTFIEDVTRFPDPKKLVSYIGLNPSVVESGKAHGRRALSHHGRGDLKSLMVQAAQCVLRKGDNDLAKWGRRKTATGKNRNVVVCAVARKLVTYVWHIMMNHPAPDRESERSFRLKLVKLANAIGKEYLAKLGYKKIADYVEAVCAQIYPPESQAQP
ncbi:MAG: IS110 family transposase [Lentisphaerae bacterium]|jgi:transposase|nr:IS110 family transposase [Lentisphaerota bacterium]